MNNLTTCNNEVSQVPEVRKSKKITLRDKQRFVLEMSLEQRELMDYFIKDFRKKTGDNISVNEWVRGAINDRLDLLRQGEFTNKMKPDDNHDTQ